MADLFDIVVARKLSGGGGGGGNPNTTKTVTGTLANPWGDIEYDELVTDIENKDATAYFTIDASALGAGQISAKPSARYSDRIFYLSGAVIPSSSVSDVTAFQVEWLGGDLNFALMVSGGNVVDISPYSSVLTTSMTVVYHPLPSDAVDDNQPNN